MVDVELCFMWLSLYAVEEEKVQKSAGRGQGRRASVVWTPAHCAPSAAAQILSVTFITPPSRRRAERHYHMATAAPTVHVIITGI